MNRVIGTSVSRKDGFAKVTGQATYTAEHQLPGLVHGYLVTSTIAKGRIRAISTQAAEQSPGVLTVVTHQNMPMTSVIPNSTKPDYPFQMIRFTMVDRLWHSWLQTR
jgi:xanthine dehydrogenase YagR molybdenum-binding subunit